MDAEKFLDFGEKHPELYLKFEKVALQLIAQSQNHYPAYAIRDYLRMETAARLPRKISRRSS